MTAPHSKSAPRKGCEACGNSPTTTEGNYERKTHHALNAALVDRLERLLTAVRYTAELYRKPTGYRSSKGTWSENTSIGFETRFEELCELALLAEKERA